MYDFYFLNESKCISFSVMHFFICCLTSGHFDFFRFSCFLRMIWCILFFKDFRWNKISFFFVQCTYYLHFLSQMELISGLLFHFDLDIRFCIMLLFHMLSQNIFSGCRITADSTWERFFSCMSTYVLVHMIFCFHRSRAIWALKLEFCCIWGRNVMFLKHGNMDFLKKNLQLWQ